MNHPPEPENTNPFEDWFFETHGGTGDPTWEHEEDADEVMEDDYSEQDEE